jgi:Transposase
LTAAQQALHLRQEPQRRSEAWPAVQSFSPATAIITKLLWPVRAESRRQIPLASLPRRSTAGRAAILDRQRRTARPDPPARIHQRHRPTDEQIRHAVYEFYTWCATYDHIPNCSPGPHHLPLANAIIAAITLGVSNAKSEDLNRVLKLEGRKAYGFRNPPTNAAACATPLPASCTMPITAIC